MSHSENPNPFKGRQVDSAACANGEYKYDLTKKIRHAVLLLPLRSDLRELPSLDIGSALTNSPIMGICQSVDGLTNRALLAVRSTDPPIATLHCPIHQSINCWFGQPIEHHANLFDSYAFDNK